MIFKFKFISEYFLRERLIPPLFFYSIGSLVKFSSTRCQRLFFRTHGMFSSPTLSSASGIFYWKQTYEYPHKILHRSSFVKSPQLFITTHVYDRWLSQRRVPVSNVPRVHLLALQRLSLFLSLETKKKRTEK